MSNMNNRLLNLFCLVEGEATSSSCPIKISPADLVDELKWRIKTEYLPRFDDAPAYELTLWRVHHPVIAARKNQPVFLDSMLDSATEREVTEEDG
ncbi:hypothetical protein BGZ70_000564 [Mortierella alpina]|uniref:Crinkler effector protein N-terminal domain-containing protein n=1 Tax=Mortierella alpina TaxID=64518 RepID=A0A9P6JC71_MORAP|nr:hypothetical protein BGZ70_000564 [Mortierella alpina]